MNQRRLDEAAYAIVTSPAREAEATELTEPLVAMIEAQRAIEASAAVLRRTNDALDGFLEALRS